MITRFFSNIGLGFLFAFGIMSIPFLVMIETFTFQIFYPVYFETIIVLTLGCALSLCIAEIFIWKMPRWAPQSDLKSVVTERLIVRCYHLPPILKFQGNSNMALTIVLAWYFFGLAIVLNEMRYDMDVTFSWFLAALMFAIGGPVWLLKTISRKTNRLIILKQVKKDY
jgi:hypothetical protein